MTEKDKIELMRRFELFGREIPKDQVMSVIARVTTESSEPEKHQLSEEIPTNTPTDLISRQDAIDTLKRVAGVGNRALDALKNLPSEDRAKGEWIVLDIVCREEICLPYECSNCGFRYGSRFNYCPNCGADMKGEAK